MSSHGKPYSSNTTFTLTVPQPGFETSVLGSFPKIGGVFLPLGWILLKIIKADFAFWPKSISVFLAAGAGCAQELAEGTLVTKEAQGVKGAKNEASIYDNNLLVLSLQLFHSHYPLTHLLFYIYFAFSLSASLSQSCFPFSLFCLACISLSCHKSTPLEAPKGSFPMASLCELCGFFSF